MHHDTVSIPLSGKLGAGKSMLIDLLDAIPFQEKSLNFSSSGYAVTSVERRRVMVHRLIMQAPEGMDVDHINGDKLDNRRANLRICTRSQNRQNTERRTGEFKGVYKAARGNLWVATITLDGRKTHLGAFATSGQAADVYDAAAYHFHGEFAHFNAPGPVTAQATAYLAEYLGPRWEVTSPTGEVSRVDSLESFCRETGLIPWAMQRVSTGKLKEHKGWECRRISTLRSRST